jgi:hypothetical protein
LSRNIKAARLVSSGAFSPIDRLQCGQVPE